VDEGRKTAVVALLVAVASILQGLESAILTPILWMRVGFANTMTLLAILLFGTREAVVVAILRSILGALMLGTFLTPSFFLSLSGAGASALVMGIFYRYGFGLGLVGVSILGAITSNLVKLCIVSIFLVQHMGVFFIVPVLMVVAVVGGSINGVTVLRLYKELPVGLRGISRKEGRDG
jgi:heptaprenyl diphosphate synthase